jgi:predicted SAM-dependent methyltransferase
MKKSEGNILKSADLKNSIRDLSLSIRRTLGWHVKRKFGQVDRKIAENYYATTKTRKLHIGCGENFLDGWLNSDYFPYLSNIFHLDATERFALADSTIDFIFSEHMIEHISYSHGSMMLVECYRVLRNNGKIRISTPDLPFLINLYQEQKTELQKEYIEWATAMFIPTAPCPNDTFVINNFVRDWGHLFIYDEKTLRLSLEMAGFSDIQRCELNKSTSAAFQDLENEKRIPQGFVNLESVTLEATKIVR